MSAAKGVHLTGTLQVGQGRFSKLFFGTAVCPYGNRKSLDLFLSADDRHVSLRIDRESAIILARRILNELEAE